MGNDEEEQQGLECGFMVMYFTLENSKKSAFLCRDMVGENKSVWGIQEAVPAVRHFTEGEFGHLGDSRSPGVELGQSCG